MDLDSKKLRTLFRFIDRLSMGRKIEIARELDLPREDLLDRQKYTDEEIVFHILGEIESLNLWETLYKYVPDQL